MQAAHPSLPPERHARQCPLVCVGGLAGGLDADVGLLKCLPADPGAAVVIVNHITLFPAQLHTILPACTAMPVELISDRLSIEPNRVFIIPAYRELHGDDGDGAATRRGIKAVGGITIAQNSAARPSPACRRAPSTLAASISFCRLKRSRWKSGASPLSKPERRRRQTVRRAALSCPWSRS